MSNACCTRINDEPLSSNVLGNEEEPNVLNSSLHKPDGTSFSETHETHVVTPAVLENWINVTAGRQQPGLINNNLRSSNSR